MVDDAKFERTTAVLFVLISADLLFDKFSLQLPSNMIILLRQGTIKSNSERIQLTWQSKWLHGKAVEKQIGT